METPRGSEAARNLQIAFRNDTLRRNFRETPSFLIKQTPTVALSSFAQAIYHAVATFDYHEEENDPYAQHDFGTVVIAGDQYFFKIDYYDETLEYGAEDPLDEKTICVMTIGRMDEY